MNKENLSNLENPEVWDLEAKSKVKASTGQRVVVSVAFPGVEFDKVAEAADRFGMKTSQFIRTAAIEKASEEPKVSVLQLTSGNVGLVISSCAPVGTAVLSLSYEKIEPVFTV